MSQEKSGLSQINSDQQQKTDDQFQEFAEKFAQAQATTPEKRTVKLQWRKCQGCSCKFSTLEREVPYGSNLKDGDTIFELKGLEEGDKFVK